eukprot:4241253-Amphidinium_carterae.1
MKSGSTMGVQRSLALSSFCNSFGTICGNCGGACICTGAGCGIWNGTSAGTAGLTTLVILSGSDFVCEALASTSSDH